MIDGERGDERGEEERRESVAKQQFQHRPATRRSCTNLTRAAHRAAQCSAVSPSADTVSWRPDGHKTCCTSVLQLLTTGVPWLVGMRSGWRVVGSHLLKDRRHKVHVAALRVLVQQDALRLLFHGQLN
jgi:hypothetical protein